MVVTKLVKDCHKRIKVYVDDSYSFFLYPGDLRKYHLEEGSDVSGEEIRRILEETVEKRAKQKALSLLKRMDYTEQEIRRKLLQVGYPRHVAEDAVEYVKSWRYLDDTRYASYYVSSKCRVQSRRQMQNNLQKKGVDRELIDRAMEASEVSEEEALLCALRKKLKKPVDELSWEEKQKTASYLYRKGFREEEIRRHLSM